ncbi:MAG: DUF929 family protein [Acidimicrobiales bacterium]
MNRRRRHPLDIVLFKRKRTGYLLLGGIVLVIVVAVVIIDHSRTTAHPAPAASTERLTPLVPQQLLTGIADIPVATYGDTAAMPSGLVPLERIHPTGAKGTTAPLESGGKPLVVANLGEFSPLCAIDRWALLEALTHFGTFSGVREISSSPDEAPADISTFTFRTMKYSSPYLAFRAFETFDRSRDTLQSPSGELARVIARFDNRPYLKAAGGLPFVDLAGEYLQPGTFPWLDAANLKSLTRSQILSEMGSKKSGGDLIDIQAAYFTAAICAIDGDRPAATCTLPNLHVLGSQLSSEPLTK